MSRLKKGWTWRAPFGIPAQDNEPAVHLTFDEAQKICQHEGKRLPRDTEWVNAAFVEQRSQAPDGFVLGKRYRYPNGDSGRQSHCLEGCTSLKKENKSLKKNLYSSNELIGNSSAIVKLRNAIDKFSKTDSRILISGPAGSGKELVCRLIHEGSLRSNNSFKVINGAILDPNHFDFELFGSENNDKIVTGVFEKSNNGTLLIDNISDVPLETQGKILRVLSDQKFHRANGASEISVNIRVICSTSKNLKEEITHGNFREDLFHRINVIPIETPYLKDAKEDIPFLIEYFVKRISDSNGLKPIFINSKNTESPEVAIVRTMDGGFVLIRKSKLIAVPSNIIDQLFSYIITLGC